MVEHDGGFDEWHKNFTSYLKTDHPSINPDLVPHASGLAEGGKLAVEDVPKDIAQLYKADAARGTRVPVQFLRAMEVEAKGKKIQSKLQLRRKKRARLASDSSDRGEDAEGRPSSPNIPKAAKKSKGQLDKDWGAKVEVSGSEGSKKRGRQLTGRS